MKYLGLLSEKEMYFTPDAKELRYYYRADDKYETKTEAGLEKWKQEF